MEKREAEPKFDEDTFNRLMNESRAAAAESVSRPKKQGFWMLGWPRLRGLKLGLGIGLLVVALAAGLAGLYSLVWNVNADSIVYTDSTTFFGDGIMLLYVVLATGLLGLASLGLPLTMVWGKGKKRAVVTFSLEFLVILIGLLSAFWWSNSHQSFDSDPAYDSGCCGAISCPQSCYEF